MESLQESAIKIKNTHISKINTLFEKEDVSLSTAENQEAEHSAFDGQLHKGLVHFYFCLEGSAVFEFGPHYSREIQKQRNYFFYNPEKDLPFNLRLAPQSRMVFFTISLKSLHELFV